ncbi:hypothetical protein ES703_56003 [subsurface metagenome]
MKGRCVYRDAIMRLTGMTGLTTWVRTFIKRAVVRKSLPNPSG